MRRFAAFALLSFVLAAPARGRQLVPRDGSAPIQVRAQRVEALVEDGLARTTLRQTFVNPQDRPLEAVYVFPLPEAAALVDVAMVVDGKRLEGLLAERKRARRVYDDVVRTKRDPALVEQIGAGTFRLSVFPVVPHEETVVELSWIEQVPLTGGAYHYALPLAAGPAAAQGEQDLTVVVRLRSSLSFARVSASREDAQVLRVGPGEALVSLERTRAAPGPDLVVTAEVAAEETRLAVTTFRAGQGDGWFQVLVTPPPAGVDRRIPRDVILVLDTSGSMASGDKIEQARRSALWLLEHLQAEDRVNVLRFSSDVQSFAPQPVAANEENLSRLAAFVAGFEAVGGTALGDALRAATDVPAVAGRVRTVVLLTDGRPTMGETDPAQVVQVARAAGEAGLRLFPFGVGQDVDSALLRGIAAAGRGRAELFRPGGEIVTRLTAFLARTSSPMVSELELAVDGVVVHDVYPRPLPDAYLGEEVVISGRYRGGGPGTVTVSGTLGGGRKALATTLDFPLGPGGARSVPYLFARQKLAHLESALRLRLGLADDAYYAALDRGAHSTEGEIVQEMIAVSLAHGVQCAATSFLVLLPEDRSRIDPRDGEAVAAALGRARELVGGVVHEATLGDERIEDHDETVFWAGEGDPGFLSDSSFDDEAFNDVIGVGGVAGGKYGGRFGQGGSDQAVKDMPGGRRDLRAAGGEGTERALEDAVGWLVAHQDDDGHWDCDGFMKHDPAEDSCDGAGQPEHDVGATGLVLLALLGDGSTTRTGPHRGAVVKGLEWLREQQDFETGRIGPKVGHGWMYGHAIATAALCEAYALSRSPLLRGAAQKAVGFIARARNPYGVWRYDAPPVGDGDTSVTGWMILALKAAEEAGLAFDRQAFTDALAWLDEVTHPATGRVGYDSRGSRSSRVPGVNDRFPTDRTECMTAVGLLCRSLLGQDPQKEKVLLAHADLLAKSPPAWSADGLTNDFCYWFFGSGAMFRMGGPHWSAWNEAMKKALLGSQRQDGSAAGSWDPNDPWGFAGGRVCSTALGALCLEVYFRRAR